MTRPLSDLPERIRSRLVIAADGCWLWTGKTDRGGYGSIKWRVGPPEPKPAGVSSRRWRYGWKSWGLSRLVWTLLYGDIPEGMQVGHNCHDVDPDCPGGPSCRHRRCANPSHLSLQTGEMNSAMAMRLPRPRKNPQPEPARKRFARDGVFAHGHDVSDPSQVYVYPTGRLICRTCHYIAKYGHPPAKPYGPRQQQGAA